MALEPLKVTKSWATGNDVDTADFNNVVDPILAWARRTNDNLKQIGLDIEGATYDFNNNDTDIFDCRAPGCS